MRNERRIFLVSFLLSLLFHAVLIFYILWYGRNENKNDKVVWVSFVEASGKSDTAHSGAFPSSPKTIDGVQEKPKQDIRKTDIKNSEEIKTEKEKKSEIAKSDVKKSDLKKSDTRKFEVRETDIKKPEVKKRDIGDIRKSKDAVLKDERRSVRERKVDKKEGSSRKISVDREKVEERLSALMKEFGVSGAGGGKVGSSVGRGIGGSGVGGVGVGEGEGEVDGPDTEEIKMIYARLVKSRVEERFEIPPSLKERDLICTVFMKVGGNGEILDIRIDRTSGDPNFDAFVIRSIMSASPFPPPPSSPLDFVIRFSNNR